MARVLCIVLYFLFFIENIYSQQTSLFLDSSMEYYASGDGLAQDHIFRIAEDSLGQMWFSTLGGVSRFDGFTFKNYTFDVDDSTSLSEKFTTNVFVDSKSRIWITTRKGMNLYNPLLENFKRYKHSSEHENTPGTDNMDGMAEDHDGNIWIVNSNGVDRFNPETERFDHFIHDEMDINRHVGDVVVDHNNEVWVSATKGLFKVSRDTRKLEFFALPPIPDVRYSKIFHIYVDDQNQIWLCTLRGLGFFDRKTGRVIYEPTPKFKGGILTFLEIHKGIFLIGTASDGLYTWDADKNKIINHREYSADDPTGLMSNTIYSVFKDSRNRIWLGLFNGVNTYHPYQKRYNLIKFEPGLNNLSNSILFFHKDSLGNSWTNTMAGLRFKAGNSDETILVSQDGEEDDGFKSIVSVASKGTHTVAQNNRIGVFDINLKNSSLNINPCQRLFKDARNWMLHQGDVSSKEYILSNSYLGICKWNPTNCDTQWIYPSKISDKLENNAVRYLAQKKDTLIFVNSGKLVFYHTDDQRTQVFEMPTVFGLDDHKNIFYYEPYVYVGWTFEIQRFDVRDRTWTVFDDPERLWVGAFAIDQFGDIWNARGQTITHVDVSTNTFKKYTEPAGFVYTEGFRSQDDLLYFCSGDGLVEIDPKQFYRDSTKPRLLFTGLDIYGKPVDLFPKPPYTKDLHIDYSHRVFTLNYAAIHFYDQDLIQYEQRLIGFDDQWRKNGTNRSVTYTNLNHGVYVFEVRARTEDGVYSDTLQIDLTISTPFYRSHLFNAIIVFLLLGIIYGIYRVRGRLNKIKQESALAKQNARYKSKFLANMSHEIRTPLNAIVGLNKLLLGENLSEAQKRYVESIDISCDNLLMIVNDILDQSKIEQGSYVIESKSFSVQKLLIQLQTLFNISAKSKSIFLNCEIDEEIPELVIGDPVRVSQILSNLISNAIKFTEVGGVTVRAFIDEKADKHCQIIFEVIDTGIGVPADMQEKIFDSFSQVKEIEDNNLRGTGLGLSIVRELTELMKGKVTVNSVHGKGSMFSVTLPFALDPNASVEIEENILTSSNKTIKVLLVEDTAFNRMLIVDIMKRYFPKSNVVEATNGREAIRTLNGQEFDLILMDVKMPVMDGIEATIEIRNQKVLRDIPILGLTANAIPEQIQMCEKAGMNQVLTKPVDIESLIKTINLYTS